MKFTATTLLAGASVVSAALNNNMNSIGYSLGGLNSAVSAYTVPDPYAAQSINQATEEVQALIQEALQVAQGLDSLAGEIADDVIDSIHTVLSQAQKVSYQIGQANAVLAQEVAELGETGANYVLGGFANCESGAEGLFGLIPNLFVGDLVAVAESLSNDVIGAFTDAVNSI